MNCVKFGFTVTNSFDKNHQKRFDDFAGFPIFDILNSQMTSNFAFDLICPRIFGVPDLFEYMSFCVTDLLFLKKDF